MKFNTQNEQILYKMIQRLESKLYGKTYEEMNAREQAEVNTATLEDGGESKHVGKHTKETIEQEVDSICNIKKAHFKTEDKMRLQKLLEKIEKRTDFSAVHRAFLRHELEVKLREVQA